MTRTIAILLVTVLASAALAQTAKLSGTSKNTFSLGLGASKLTLTNSTGTLSLSSGLRVTAGAVNLSGTTGNNLGDVSTCNFSNSVGTPPFTVNSITMVSGLNAQYLNSASWGTVSSGQNGSVVYLSGVGAMNGSSLPGVTGAFLAGTISGAPTWKSLPSAQVFVGDSSSAPTARAISGDVTLSNTGVVTIANDAVTSAKILNGTIIGTDLATDTIAYSALQPSVRNADWMVTISVGAESAKTIRVTIQVKDPLGNNLSGSYLVPWWWSSASCGPPSALPGITGATYITGSRWHAYTANQNELGLTGASGNIQIDFTTPNVGSFPFNAAERGQCESALITWN